MERKLAKLERVDLRDYWGEEAREFTPWLAQPANLRLLAETIGIDLELVATESTVGAFKADIIAREVVPPVQVSASSGSWSDIVLIALGNNPTGATLTGNSSVSIDGGTSRQWSDLRIDRPGNGYTLVAILRGSGSGVTSAPFNITP